MAAIGALADFMWKVAGAPPKSTGAPGRMTCAMVMPASTSTVWNTVAPTMVTGAMSPWSVTGTISTGMPASTQSMRFWQESSEYRKLPLAVIVKIDIGRAMRSARSRRKSCIISTMRGTPCSVKAPGVRDADFDVVVGGERGREVGDVAEAVGEPDVLHEVGRAGQPDLA